MFLKVLKSVMGFDNFKKLYIRLSFLMILVFLVSPALVKETPTGVEFVALMLLSLLVPIVIAPMIGYICKKLRFSAGLFKWIFLIIDFFLILVVVRLVFLPSNFGLLDGQELSRKFSQQSLARDLYQILLSLGISFILLLASHLKKVKLIEMFYVGFVVFAIAFSCMESFKTNQGGYQVESIQHYNMLGKKRNIIFVILDSAQGAIYEKVMKNNDLQKAFRGFTLYDKAIAQFPMTSFSLPTIFDGDFSHLQNKSVKEVNERKRNDFITDAEARGFNVFRVPYEANTNWLGSPAYSYENNLSDRKIIEKITIFVSRSFPLRLTQRVLRAVYGNYRRYFDINFKHKIASEKFLVKLAKRYDFSEFNNVMLVHHNYSAHPPVCFNSEGVSQFTSDHSGTGDFVGEGRYLMGVFGKLFARLKQLKVWDDSLIVILGDHGNLSACSNSTLFKNDEYDPTIKGNNWRPVGMHNPAVFVKLPHDDKAFTVSSKALSLTDMRPIINSYLSGDKNDLVGYFNQISDERRNIVYLTEIDSSENYLSTKNFKKTFVTGNILSLHDILKDVSVKSKDFLKLELNERYMLDGNRKYLSGEMVKNKDGVWIKNRPVSLFANYEGRIDSEMLLTFEMAGLVKKGMHPAQEILVSINDVFVKKISVTNSVIADGKKAYKAVIPPQIFAGCPQKMKITIEPINPVTPAAIKAWAGEYLLSVFLYSFSINEIPAIDLNASYSINKDSEFFIEEGIEETNGVWVTSMPVSIYGKFAAAPNTDKLFRIEMAGLVKAGVHPIQIIGVSANDRFVGNINVTNSVVTDGKKEYELIIPNKYFYPNSNKIKITLEPKNPITPTQVNAWRGDYLLSVYLYSFSINDIK